MHVCCGINILGSQLSPSSINLVPAQAGKVTIGLASHWPCVTDATYGLKALGRDISTPHMLQWSMAHLYLTLLLWSNVSDAFIFTSIPTRAALNTGGWQYLAEYE